MPRFIATAVCMALALALCHIACAHEFSHCVDGCPEHAECVANKCECLAGYERALSPDTGLPYCPPICAVPCMPHANCVAPDRCECAAGHVLDELGAACVPVRSTTATPPLRSTTYATSTDVWSTSTAKYRDENSEDANDGDYGMPVRTVTQEQTSAEPEVQTSPTDKCPSDYVYVQGGCRPLIRTTSKTTDFNVLVIEQREVQPPPPPSRGYYVWIGVSLVVLAIAAMVVCVARSTN